MNLMGRRLQIGMVLSLMIVSFPAVAYSAEEDFREIDEKALSVLTRMAETLSQAKQFSFSADMSFDVVQDSGLKIEFGEARQVVVSRPNRIRVDATKRDGSQSLFIFDGQKISVFNNKENVYASVAKSGSLDDAIVYFLNDLDMRLPLAEMFSTKLPQIFDERLRAAYYLEESDIGGVRCDHIAVRAIGADIQLWVAQQGNTPQRLVITYRRAEGQPQFRAQFRDWNFSPEVADGLFSFVPPEGAAQINIVPPQRRLVQPTAAQGE